MKVGRVEVSCGIFTREGLCTYYIQKHLKSHAVTLLCFEHTRYRTFAHSQTLRLLQRYVPSIFKITSVVFRGCLENN